MSFGVQHAVGHCRGIVASKYDIDFRKEIKTEEEEWVQEIKQAGGSR